MKKFLLAFLFVIIAGSYTGWYIVSHVSAKPRPIPVRLKWEPYKAAPACSPSQQTLCVVNFNLRIYQQKELVQTYKVEYASTYQDMALVPGTYRVEMDTTYHNEKGETVVSPAARGTFYISKDAKNGQNLFQPAPDNTDTSGKNLLNTI